MEGGRGWYMPFLGILRDHLVTLGFGAVNHPPKLGWAVYGGWEWAGIYLGIHMGSMGFGW